MKYLFIFLIIGSFNLSAQDMSLEWAIGQGDVLNDQGKEIIIDFEQNILICGFFTGTVDFDPSSSEYNLESSGLDCFVQKLDQNGNLLWAINIDTYHDNTSDNSFSISTDKYGNVYLIGFFLYTVDFDPGPSVSNLSAIGYNNTFILKLDSNGNFEWAVNYTGTVNQDGLSITNDSLGNVYAVGSFGGYGDFDPSSSEYILESAGSQDVYILKLDTDGEFLWAKQTEGSHNESVSSIIIENDQNLYLTGSFYGTVDFDPGAGVTNLTAEGNFQSNTDIYILKLDLDGEFVWVRQIGGLGQNNSKSICSDSDGNIYTTGHFYYITDFDPGPLETNLTANGTDIFVEKLDSEGNFLWAKQIGNSSSDVGFSISTDDFGNSYTTGYFIGNVDFDPGIGIYNLVTNGTEDICILKLSPNGEFIWANGYGGVLQDQGLSIAIDNDKNIYTTGFFIDTVDFDPGIDTLLLTTNSTGPKIFIQKLSQDTCSSFGISFDSITDISCNSFGIISSYGFGGIEPYSYSWNTTPLQFDSILVVESSGVFTVTISDAIGCEKNYSILMEEPILNGFDLDANLVSESFRPGFSSSITIDAYNNGCIPTEGTITLIMDSLVNFDNSDVDPDINLGDTLIWNYSETTYDDDNIVLNIEVLTDSLAIIGDTICFNLSISPLSGDVDSTNNYKHYCYQIVNGYDPNDKQIYPLGICENHYVLKTDDLTYTIRFQNTGNAEAINVHITDTLSSYLDMNTIEVLGSSHDMYTLIRPGNVVDFIFDDIYLPDSTSNEPESHGYVIFKIRPNSIINNGSYVENKSEIYFDFNPPVVTNTVFNTLVNELLSCDINMGVDEDVSRVNDVKVYPNPSNGILTVDFGGLKKVGIKLFSINGKLIYSKENISGHTHQFTLDSPPGIYILEISASKGKQFHKVVIE